MNSSFEMTPLQKMYITGEDNSIFLGGKFPFIYFATFIKDFCSERFQEAFGKVLENNNLLSAKIKDDMWVNNKPAYNIVYSDTEGDIDKENQKISDYMCGNAYSATESTYIAVHVLKCGNDAYVHFLFHGILIDGISSGLILKQLYTYYNENILPSAVDFADYSERFGKYLNSDEYSKDYKYFEDLYSNFCPEEFSFPFSTQPDSLEACRCNFTKKVVGKELYQNVAKLATENNISPFVLMMTVFGYVISRYSGSRNFYMNIPCSARFRDMENIEISAGLFSNFIVFPFSIDGSLSLIENAINNSVKFRETAKHRFFPGADAVKIINGKGDTSYSKNIIFTAIPFDESENNYSVSDFRVCTNQVVLESDIVLLNGEYFITLSYPEGLFDKNIIENLSDMFVLALSETVRNNGTNKTIPLMEKETELINSVHEKKETSDKTLNEVILESFEKYSSKPLCIYRNKVFSYNDVLKKACCLSKKTGLANYNTIAILLPKGIEQVISLYSALLFSGTYMPLDTGLSASEISHCIKNADISVVITDTTLLSKLDETDNVTVINIDDTDLTDTDDDIPQIKTKSYSDTRIIINTSGTTGKPKGIMIKDSSLVSCFINGTEIFGFENGSSLIALTNFGHDMAIFDTLGVIFFGGCIVMPDETQMKEPSSWIELIERYNIAVWQSVPSFMEMLMIYLEQNGTERQFTSLKQILHGGEFLSCSLVNKIFKCFPDCDVFNVGGPTETTVWNIRHKVTAEDLENNVIPYGIPFPNTEYHIRNRYLEECPTGVKGIMYCSGNCLSDGYIGNNDETSKKFIEIDGVRSYNTGDIGIRCSNGELLICGREDFQVKIHGKRVELSGIENVLCEYHAVNSVSVVYDSNISKLTAVYVSAEEIPTSDFSEFLKNKLPEYMIPKIYIRLESIPLTRNGKHDKKKLAEIILEYIEKNNTAEKNKTSDNDNDIRAEILEIIGDEIDFEITDEEINFFEAGGDSLSAVKISAKVSGLIGKSVTVFDLINSETLGEWLDMIL